MMESNEFLMQRVAGCKYVFRVISSFSYLVASLWPSLYRMVRDSHSLSTSRTE